MRIHGRLLGAVIGAALLVPATLSVASPAQAAPRVAVKVNFDLACQQQVAGATGALVASDLGDTTQHAANDVKCVRSYDDPDTGQTVYTVLASFRAGAYCAASRPGSEAKKPNAKLPVWYCAKKGERVPALSFPTVRDGERIVLAEVCNINYNSEGLPPANFLTAFKAPYGAYDGVCVQVSYGGKGQVYYTVLGSLGIAEYVGPGKVAVAPCLRWPVWYAVPAA
jgi:hypothetical protein